MRGWLNYCIAMTAVASGCIGPQSGISTAPKIAPPPPPDQFASFTVQEAEHLSGDEAKAILIARACVEVNERYPWPLRFKVDRIETGWAVMVSPVTFVDEAGDTHVSAPGGLVTVYIDTNWKVSKVFGGA